MLWPTIDQMREMLHLPEGYRCEQLGRAEVLLLIDSLRTWYPDLSVGVGCSYLRPNFYYERVSLRGEQEREFYVALIMCGDEMAGMGSWEWEPDALTLYTRLGVVAHAHRRSGIAARSIEFTTNLARAMGAGFVYGLTTLKIPSAQIACERAGWQLFGFAPGYDRELVAPGVVKRVFDALYGKVLAPEEELLRPDPANMTPRTRALWELMFPSEPAISSTDKGTGSP